MRQRILPRRSILGWVAAGIVIVGGGIGGWEARAAEGREYQYTEAHMGTRFTLLLYAEDDEVANRAAAAAFRRIAQLEKVFSTYDPRSEARKLCAAAEVGQWVDVSPDLWKVLKYSREFSEKTSGAFDVTVGPVTRLWRQARRARRLPKPEKLMEAQQAVGYQNYEVDPQRPRIRLLKPGMRFDFGGIAKGYALDEAFTVLVQHGITRCSINGGGDVLVGDLPPTRKAWSVILHAAGISSVAPRLRLPPRHAVATSGDAYQFLVVDGKRYSHLIDPRTGQAVEGHRESSAIARSGMEADAWASAGCLLSPDEIAKLVQGRDDLALRVFVETDSPWTGTDLWFGGMFDRLFPDRESNGASEPENAELQGVGRSAVKDSKIP